MTHKVPASVKGIVPAAQLKRYAAEGNVLKTIGVISEYSWDREARPTAFCRCWMKLLRRRC